MRGERTSGPTAWVSVAASSAYWLLILVILPVMLARAAEGLRPQLYDVTTETVMPHLEENLRYAVTHEERCLGESQLATAFPVLSHPALAGCLLEPARVGAGVLAYDLVCEGAQGTTGGATWELSERRLSGTLHVRLGGKNMTFDQRITATLRGACSSTD
jgi:hypothetical protein